MCLGILLVRIPHHVLNKESKWIYRKLRGYLFLRFTKYPRNLRNFLSSKIIRPTVNWLGIAGPVDCFNKSVSDCYIRVYQSFYFYWQGTAVLTLG